MRLLRLVPALILGVAWLMLVASFFLPASGDLRGWEACLASWATIVASPLVMLVEPRLLMLLSYPFVNAALLLTPLLAASDDDDRLGYLAVVAFVGAAPPWFLPTSLTGKLLIGFYLWSASMVMLGLGCLLLLICRQRDERARYDRIAGGEGIRFYWPPPYDRHDPPA